MKGRGDGNVPRFTMRDKYINMITIFMFLIIIATFIKYGYDDYYKYVEEVSFIGFIRGVFKI